MIENITGIATVTEESLYANEATQELGRDDFLKMFLAQLKAQDPLNPMEGSEFSVQLAQFSSLEQLFNVNDNLETLRTGQNDDSRFQVLGLIGKEVLAEGALLSLEEEGEVRGGFSLNQAGNCSVLISDSEGYPVREMDLGVLDAGQHPFAWDGCDEEGNRLTSGIYYFDIAAVDESGSSLPVSTRIMGEVSRVDLSEGEPLLYVGSIPLRVAEIMEVKTLEASQGSE
jgi:flagellar basal-body rod modification protein FlgD